MVATIHGPNMSRCSIISRGKGDIMRSGTSPLVPCACHRRRARYWAQDDRLYGLRPRLNEREDIPKSTYMMGNRDPALISLCNGNIVVVHMSACPAEGLTLQVVTIWKDHSRFT